MISKYLKKKIARDNMKTARNLLVGFLIGGGLMIGYCTVQLDTMPAVIGCFDKAEVGEHGMTEAEEVWFKYGAFKAAQDYTEDCEEDLLSKDEEYDKLNSFYEDLKRRTK